MQLSIILMNSILPVIFVFSIIFEIKKKNTNEQKFSFGREKPNKREGVATKQKRNRQVCCWLKNNNEKLRYRHQKRKRGQEL